MTYLKWKKSLALIVQNQPNEYARLWNLEHETRINKKSVQFKRLIGRKYKSQRSAIDALNEAIEETKPINSKWLGSLKFSGRLPNSVVTYMDSLTLSRYYSRTFFNPKSPRPSRSVTLSRPLMASLSGGKWVPAKRFIWITFDRNLPQDPTAVKREMGLDHYPQDYYIYKLDLALKPKQSTFIPTCLDAGLNSAWMPPPVNFPKQWGLTRNLTNGQRHWPELLVETQDYLHQSGLQGQLVSPPDKLVAINPMHIDYKIGR